MNNRFQQVSRTHDAGDFLTVQNPLYRKQILDLLLILLKNDAGDGDVTTEALKIMNLPIKAHIVSKSEGVLAGIQEVKLLLERKWKMDGHKPLFHKVDLLFLKQDGEKIRKNDVILHLSGKASDIFKVERTVLNLLQRMSGIATQTACYKAKVFENVLLTPTRKTLWGLLDKRACSLGFAGTHRLNLSDAFLVKDTHLKAMNYDFELVLKRMIASSKSLSKKPRFYEIEVESHAQAFQLAKTLHGLYAELRRGVVIKRMRPESLVMQTSSIPPLYLMLDNLKPSALKKIIDIFKKDGLYDGVFFEASGGITLDNIQDYAKTGVDILSIGALTHSAPALDISLKVL